MDKYNPVKYKYFRIWFLYKFSIQDNIYSNEYYRLGPVNSKSFVGKVFLWIKWKFELQIIF